MDIHCNQSPSTFKVLNHGDCWVNNMMFKYDANKLPIDIVFIDYQLSFYSSPGIDFNYFFGTSPTNEVRENSRDALFDLYYNSFSGVLSKLGSPRVTDLNLEVVRKEIRTRELYGFLASIGLLPVIMKATDKAQEISMEAMADLDVSQKIRHATYHNPVYVRAIKLIVSQCDEHGVFGQ